MAKRFRSVALLFLAACAGAPVADGAKLYEAGDYAAALESYSKMVRQNPNDAEAFYRRACCLMHLMDQQGVKEGPVESALADLDRSIELAPDEYRVYYARAMMYATVGRFKEAAQDLLICVQSQDKALKRKAHLRLGEIYDEKFEEMQAAALRHYESYVQMGGSEPRAISRHGELKKGELERSGEVDQERVQLTQLALAKQAALAGRHSESLDLVSRILNAPSLSKESLQEAKDLYIQERLAVELERKADALFEAATGMIKDGKIDAAKEILEELVKKYPSTDAARSKAPAALIELLKKLK